MTLSNYNHEWRDKNKFPDGCADLFWWLEYWKEIHAKNLERFKIPEFERNCNFWSFKEEPDETKNNTR